MKKTLLVLTVLVLASQIGHGQKKEAIVESEPPAAEIELAAYPMDGLLLKGEIRTFDIYRNRVGTLEMSKITPVRILERTEEMYHVEGSTDGCQKAYFLKVRYDGTDHIVFGRDVYRVMSDETHKIATENGETLALLPMVNFDMEAVDEIGLTGCDDYSLLVLYNETKGTYSLMRHPEGETWGRYEYAILSNNEGASEDIYSVSTAGDTLIVGIRVSYQEGGAFYNLKATLSDDFPRTEVSDFVSFETEDDFLKMSKKITNTL